MENEKMSITIIGIGDFSVAHYGGKEGFQNTCRVIISLFDKAGSTFGFIKFFNTGCEVESDGFDAMNFFHLNFPESSYSKVIDSLRSRRPIQILFDGKNGLLSENKLPPITNRGINLN